MEKNIENFISDLSYDNLRLIKQACIEAKKVTKLLDNVNKLCNCCLKKYVDNEPIIMNDVANNKYDLFISQTKELSFEELKTMSTFFSLVYVITKDSKYFQMSQQLNTIIYIKEQLEMIAANRINRIDIDSFEFYIKRMDKSTLKQMNEYFNEDLEKTAEKVMKLVY